MADVKPTKTEDLSAYERWELPALESSGQPAAKRPSPKKSAPRIKLPTAADVEKIRAAAYREGFEEGKKAGHAEGMSIGIGEGTAQGKDEGLKQGLAAAQSQIQQKVAELQQLMSGLSAPIEAQQEMLSQALLNTSVAIARSVIHRELESDSSVIEDLAKEAISLLRDESDTPKLRVNPADISVVSEALSSPDQLEMISDPAIVRGGCILESNSQLIDFTVEKRFQKVIQGMLTAAAHKGEITQGENETNIDVTELSDYSNEVLEVSDTDESLVSESSIAEEHKDVPDESIEKKNEPEASELNSSERPESPESSASKLADDENPDKGDIKE